MTSELLAQKLVKELKRLGVKRVVSCPGGRSAVVLNAIIDEGSFNIESFYDERSAAFYALGKSLNLNEPVAVLTTSGSAVVSLYPALLESVYQEKGKLILITADRPLELKHSGAPQTINQDSVFSENKVQTLIFDLESDLKKQRYPMHINLHLDDPNASANEKLEASEDALLICSSLDQVEALGVKEEFKNYRGAMVLESFSNLTRDDFPKACHIKFADSFLKNNSGLRAFKKVVRVGGVPLLKEWRSAENHDCVYFWNKRLFPGTIGAKPLDLKSLGNLLSEAEASSVFKSRVQKHEKEVEGLIKQHKASEVAVVRDLSSRIPSGSKVFIGNSLPVREWEFVNWENFHNIGQRGVNGIDGSLALALGQLDSQRENWIVIGDLTCLYNVSDFIALQKNLDKKVRIVVINNNGGRIFERIFKKNVDKFVNSQNFSFEKLAQLWSVPYMTSPEGELPTQCLIELEVNPAMTKLFWNDLDKLGTE